jgi:hypothetical protein
MTAFGKGAPQKGALPEGLERGSHKGTLLVTMLYFNENTKLKRKEGKESKGAFARYLYIIVCSPRLM